MKKTRTLLALGAATLIPALFSACVKEKGEPHEAGASIAFSAATGYESGPFVRTEYSGEMVDVPLGLTTRRFERIDWVKDFDWIRILCEAAEDGPVADYAIAETPSTSGAGEISSVTSITPLVRYGLHWGTGDHYFYALYPAEGMKSNYEFNDRQVVADNAKIETIDGNKAKVTGYIPPEQELYKVGNEYKANMNYAYMYAQQKVAAGSTGPVKLAFNPLVTAFEFTILGVPGNVVNAKLTQVRLSSASSRMTGKFEAVLASGANPVISPIGESGKVITASLPDGGVLLSENAPVKFTFLALPFDQTELKLTLLFENGQTRSLELKDNGNWLTVGACKKVYIRNLGVPDIYTYILDHTGPTVALSDGTEAQVLYRNSQAAGETTIAPFDTYKTADGTSKIPVDVEVDAFALADENGNPVMSGGEIAWQNWTSESRPEGLTDAYSTGTEVNREMGAQASVYSSIGAATEDYEILLRAEKLKANTNNYGAAANLDLSLYDIENLLTPRASGKPTTANCYIVDRAGTYRFPLVYGNAIDWTRSSAPLFINGVNPYSYQVSATPGADEYTAWHRFRRYDNQPITNPYILDDLGLTPDQVEAVVVWEDVENATYSFITVSPTIVNVPSSGLFWDPKTNGYKSSVPYISFTIPQGDIDTSRSTDPSKCISGIRQGNAMIALRFKASPKRIIWSWHIWVTDGYDSDGDLKGDGLTPLRVPTRNSSVTSYNMMLPMNLGWCTNNTVDRYRDRVWYVRLTQVEGNAEPIVFKVVQTAPVKVKDYRAGEPYYQWGRKDPFLPSDGLSRVEAEWRDGMGINKESYSQAGYQIIGVDANYPNSTVNKDQFDAEHPSGVAYAIQNPYIFYVCSESLDATTDNSRGTLGNWFRSALPFNLWNMANGGVYGEDIKVAKTVYDPCPPGYSVPHRNAFTWFTRSGENNTDDAHGDIYTVIEPPTTELVEDLDGDGVITERDIDVGWYFKTGQGGNTIFFPMSGVRTGWAYREWPGEVHSVRGDGLAWTASSNGWNLANNLYIDYSLRVKPFHTNWASMSVPVRPAKEL